MNDQQYVEVGVVLYPGKVLQDGKPFFCLLDILS